MNLDPRVSESTHGRQQSSKKRSSSQVGFAEGSVFNHSAFTGLSVRTPDNSLRLQRCAQMRPFENDQTAICGPVSQRES